jgi:hypothetical protein
MSQDRMMVEIGDQVKVLPPEPTDHLPDLDGKTATF